MNKNINRRDFLQASGEWPVERRSWLAVLRRQAGHCCATSYCSAAGKCRTKNMSWSQTWLLIHTGWMPSTAARMQLKCWVWPGNLPGPAEFDTPAQVTALEQIISTKPSGLLVAALTARCHRRCN